MPVVRTMFAVLAGLRSSTSTTATTAIDRMTRYWSKCNVDGHHNTAVRTAICYADLCNGRNNAFPAPTLLKGLDSKYKHLFVLRFGL